MKRALLFFVLLALTTAGAGAQPLPPGHPPAPSVESDDSVPAHEPSQPEGQLPAGHPPVKGGQQRDAAAQLEPDTSSPDPTLPKGSIAARIVDPSGKPLANVPVRLGILSQSVAEGEAKDYKNSTTDADGRVHFDGLQIGTKFSYRVTVKSDPAEYASDPFNLREDSGQNVLLHIYPVTTDIRRTRIAMRSFLVIEPRDDAFQFEVMVRIFNVGTVTWVPHDVVMELPHGWKAFNAQESMNDTRFEAEGDEGARLVGTFSPGQHELVFRFQLTNEHDPSTEVRFGVLPHTGEFQVMAAAARGMSLEVPGMEPAEAGTTQDGRRVLVTGKQLRPGEKELREVLVRLTGIPTPASGRWVAVALALAFLTGGLGFAFRSGGSSPTPLASRDVSRARSLLLGEIIALERARKSGAIGPRTYESARRALLGGLARLEAQAPPSPVRTRPKRRAVA